MANRLRSPPLDNIGKKVKTGAVGNKYFLVTGDIVKHGSKGNAKELGKSRLHSLRRRALFPEIMFRLLWLCPFEKRLWILIQPNLRWTC
jgi:hypothetical protein